MKYISKDKVKENDLKLLVNSQNQIINSNKLTQFSQSQDLTDFNSACNIFKQACNEFASSYGITSTNGSYDAMLTVINNEIAKAKSNNDIQKLKFLCGIKILFANFLCLHEAKKIGLSAPDWFFKCWNISE